MTHAAGSRPGARRAAGLSFVELLLSVMILALIAGAITAMLDAVAYGTQDRHDLRRLVVRKQAMTQRLVETLRASRMVLAQGDGVLVVWTEDADDDGRPALTEMERISFDADAGVLRIERPRSDLSDAVLEAMAAPLDLTSDFNALVSASIARGRWEQETWTRDVAAFTVSITADVAQDATVVSALASLREGGLTDLTPVVVQLRNHPSLRPSSGLPAGDDVVDDEDEAPDESESAIPRQQPNRDDDAPGNSGNAPGNSGNGRGNSGNAPGNSGNSGNAPGNSGNAPGNSGNAPGNSGNGRGNSGNGRGNSGNSEFDRGAARAGPGNSGNAGRGRGR